MVTDRASIVHQAGSQECQWVRAVALLLETTAETYRGGSRGGPAIALALLPLFLIKVAQGLASQPTLDYLLCLQRGESSMRSNWKCAAGQGRWSALRKRNQELQEAQTLLHSSAVGSGVSCHTHQAAEAWATSLSSIPWPILLTPWSCCSSSWLLGGVEAQNDFHRLSICVTNAWIHFALHSWWLCQDYCELYLWTQ